MLTYIELYPEYFPSFESYHHSDRTRLARMANATGKAAGKVKKFFNRTETKATTLLAYWAADTLLGVLILLSMPNVGTFLLVSSLTIIHTYATIGVLLELRN